MSRRTSLVNSSESKQRRFDELMHGPFATSVLAANRAYLDAALADTSAGAGERWSLTCLPGTRTSDIRRRLSAVSMRNMEVFVLHVDKDWSVGSMEGFVNVRRSTVLRGYDSPYALERSLGLDEVYETHYQAAGVDQLRLVGSPTDLIRALADPYVASATRDLAAFLTTSNTVYARFHNPYLTEAVLS